MDEYEPDAVGAAALAANPGGSRRTRALASWASALGLAAVLVPVVLRLTGWDRGPLAYAVAFLPWVVPACVVPLALALLARSGVLAAAVLVPLIASVAWLVPVFTASSVASAAPVELRVATLNATMGQADASAIVAMVADRSIDVLAVEELTPAEVDALHAAGLDDALPYSELLPQLGVEGTGVWSRLQFNSAMSVQGLRSHAVRVSVTVGKEPVTIYAVHPAAPGLFDHSTWATDMAKLAALLAPRNGAVLVAGDFNTTRDQRSFRELEDLGFADAADQAGAGFLPTFPQGRLPLPVVAIDHIIARDVPFVARDVTAVTIPGADHRALVVTYAGP